MSISDLTGEVSTTHLHNYH